MSDPGLVQVAHEQQAMMATEHALCRKLGECASEYMAILAASGDAGRWDRLTDIQQADLREFIAHIHDLQHAIMARAAIRCYPELYRS